VSLLDVLENKATTHSWNLSTAMSAIKQADNGVLVLLNCGETSEQLFSQFASLDAKGARPLGRAASMDLRTYGIGAQILKDIGVCRMQLLANPRKMPSMAGFDLEVTGYLPKPGA
jgi:3,4-dihydroxy 2-butanone 4-phosphate synthase/GTP cyclohydrolase II